MRGVDTVLLCVFAAFVDPGVACITSHVVELLSHGITVAMGLDELLGNLIILNAKFFNLIHPTHRKCCALEVLSAQPLVGLPEGLVFLLKSIHLGEGTLVGRGRRMGRLGNRLGPDL